MRILAIRGCNLASLAGEFEIDLARAPLGGAGVFAIVGPTGAGKSTLLDAVCVALFDRTPRLANRSTVVVGRGDDDPSALGAQDVRSLLRRGASAGWAEVDFESGDARRYRARWSVRRARGAFDGRLQDSQLSLTTIDGSERFGGTRTETLKEIQRRLGLSFDQFRRSALLAQGEFAAFLRADGRDRSELLERMTGTEIYSKLSVAAHARAAIAVQELRDRQGAALAIAVLADEARAAAEAELAVARDARAAARARLAEAEAAARWLAEAARRTKAVEDAEAARVAAEAALATAPRDELALRRRAETLRAAWNEVARLELQLGVARGEIARAEADVVATRATRQAQQAAVAGELAAIERALGEHAAARGGALAARAAAATDHDAAVDEVARARREAAKFHEQRGISLDAAGKAENAARLAHREAEKLVAIVDEAAAAATARRELQRQLAETETAADIDAELRAIVETERANAQAVRAERERAAAQLRLAAGYAHARAELVAGEACPLCGAAEHPWGAEHGGGTTDDTRAAVERGISELVRDADARLAEAAAHVERAAGELANITARDGQRARDRKRLRACLDTADATARVAGERWRAQLASLGELVLVEDAASGEAREWARERVAAARGKLEAASAARSHAEAVATASQEAQARVEAKQAEADRRAAIVRQHDAKLAAIAAAIERVQAARGDVLARRAERELALERQLAEHDARLAAAFRARDALATELADATTRLETARTAAGFAADDLRRLLADGPARTESLVERIAELERAADRARTLLAERRRLADDHAVTRPSAPIDELAALAAAARDARLAELAAAVTAADHHAAALQATLAADTDARARRAAALEALAAAERAVEIDRVLGEVIGSHDGKLFRSFAQSLTLDALLAVANSHLDELAPRYQLERVPRHDLELQVIDRDLGAEVRSVQSLSGGESFLVSLALALGLSSMSAHDVRVRTLLIDEGFGSLDPATLDSALAVLDALQATGRQVGVISHVPALVERVGAHVRVAPRGGGRSEVIVAEA